MRHHIQAAGIVARGGLAWTNMAEQVATSHHFFPALLCMWKVEHNVGTGGKPCTGKSWQLDMSGYTWLYSWLIHISRYCLNSASHTMDLYTLLFIPDPFTLCYWLLNSTLILTPLLWIANSWALHSVLPTPWTLRSALDTTDLRITYSWPLYSLNQNAYRFAWLNSARKPKFKAASQPGQISGQPAKLPFDLTH